MTEYIDRNAAVKAIMETKWERGSDGAMAMEIVASAPSADVVPVEHGKWIESANFDTGFWVCSKCGFVSEAIAAPKLYNYCPNCGKKMDGGAVDG